MDLTDSQSTVSDPLDEIQDRISLLKSNNLPCNKLLDVAFYLHMDPQDQMRLDQGLRECEFYYSSAIESTLDELGLIGKAIRGWLDVINVFLINSPDHGERLINILRIDQIPHLFELLELPFRAQSQPIESSTVAIRKQQKAALLYGMGLCIYVRQGPLRAIAKDLATYWQYDLVIEEEQLETGSGPHFTFVKELKRRLVDGRLSILVLLLALSNLCNNLKDNPLARDESNIMRLDGWRRVLEAVTEASLDLNQYLVDGNAELEYADVVAIFRHPPEGRLCNHYDFYRFQRGWDFLSGLFPDRTGEQMEIVRAGANSFVDYCYSRIASQLALDRVQLIPGSLQTYIFALSFRQALTNLQLHQMNYLGTMDDELNTRNYGDSPVAERLFFDIPLNSRVQLNERQALEAYMDGLSGPCSFFASFVDLYREEQTGLFHLMELLTFLSRINNFWPTISNEATGFYFMWSVCHFNRQFKMDSTGSSADELNEPFDSVS